MIEPIVIPEERMRILRRDKRWKVALGKLSDVKVEINSDVLLEGDDPLQLMRVKDVMKAFGRGFNFDDALNLLDEEFILEMIELREFAGKSKERQAVLKGRVIGTQGRIKKLIEKEADVKIAVQGKTISIIGRWDNMEFAKKIIEMILQLMVF